MLLALTQGRYARGRWPLMSCHMLPGSGGPDSVRADSAMSDETTEHSPICSSRPVADSLIQALKGAEICPSRHLLRIPQRPASRDVSTAFLPQLPPPPCHPVRLELQRKPKRIRVRLWIDSSPYRALVERSDSLWTYQQIIRGRHGDNLPSSSASNAVEAEVSQLGS